MLEHQVQLHSPIRQRLSLHEGHHVLRPAQHQPPLYNGGTDQYPGSPIGIPLITTKLQIPSLSTNLITREQLLRQLTQATQHPLTLVVAPAGYGKTTLVSTWARQLTTPVAWVSLDRSDDTPHRFWAYVIAALNTTQVNVGLQAQTLLEQQAMTSIEPILATLLNTLVTAQPMFLILDDYDSIHDPCIHQSLTFFLEHLPPCIHVAITSRAAPPLPLAHWRATDALAELSVAALCFSHSEASKLMTEIVQQPIADELITTLMERTEGWVTGLQLAARGACTSPDVGRFLQDFHGSHRDIQDYLDQEVLCHIPADMHAFVLQTASADRLCAALCAVLCAAPERTEIGAGAESVHIHRRKNDIPTIQGRVQDIEAMLTRIEQMGLFLIPLDTQRGWYRYQRLFAEAMQHRVRQTNSELAIALQKRAAAWNAEQVGAPPSLQQVQEAYWQDEMQRTTDSRSAPDTHAVAVDRVLSRPASLSHEDLDNLSFSQRELEVLRLLADGYANQHIAQTLIISINTVKMHLQHLYDKLNVHNRVQAIQRARMLGML